MTRPTILEVAAMASRKPGIDPPGPRWEATLAYLYGLPLSDEQVAEVAAATQRSPEAIVEHARKTLGRRRFREFWARVGRRGRKSSTAALVAVYEAWWGGHEHNVMPGEQGLVAVISKDTAGSVVVARFVRLYAEALGFKVSTSRIGNVQILEMAGCPFGIATLASNATAPRGYAIPVLILDEFAHVQIGEDYVDSDKAIISAAGPAMAQFDDPLLVGISTPLGRDGEFHDRVERSLGADDDHECLSVTGPTWEWNPDVSEEATRRIEKDPDTHSREFGANPSDKEGLALVPADVDLCFEERPGRYRWGRPILILDAAESLDEFAWGLASFGEPSREPVNKWVMVNGERAYPERDADGSVVYEEPPDRGLLSIFRIGGWSGPELRMMPMDEVARELARIAHNSGATQAISDQRAAPYLAALLSVHRISLRSFAWSAPSKHEAVTLLRTMMRDRQIYITGDATMRQQLKKYPRRISGNGFVYGSPRVKDDRAALLITLAHALLEERGTSTNAKHYNIENAPTRLAIGGRVIGRAR